MAGGESKCKKTFKTPSKKAAQAQRTRQRKMKRLDTLIKKLRESKPFTRRDCLQIVKNRNLEHLLRGDPGEHHEQARSILETRRERHIAALAQRMVDLSRRSA